MEDVAHAHLALEEVGEGSAGVALSVGEEEGAVEDVGLGALAGEEDGLYDVEDVDEGDFLWAVAYGEVDVLADALGHEEVVALAGAIDACGAQDYPGELVVGAQPLLCGELALTVGGVGPWRVGVGDGGVD